jgi:hypothetical protein
MNRRVKAKVLILMLILHSFSAHHVAYAADIKVLNTENSCAGPWGSSATLWEGPASRFVAPSARTLVGATLNYSVTSGSYGPNQASGQRLAFWSNSGSLPSTLIGRMSYSSYSGSQVTFRGNVSLPASGTYWIQVQSNFSAYFCYVSTQSNAGSESGWSTQVGMAYGSSGAGETPTAFTAFSGAITNYTMAYSLYAAGPETVTIDLFNRSVATKGVVDTITATTSNPGKVTFYANDKRIAKCINIATSANSANCPWKPTVNGSSRIHSVFKPASGAEVVSSVISVGVGKRSTIR